MESRDGRARARFHVARAAARSRARSYRRARARRDRAAAHAVERRRRRARRARRHARPSSCCRRCFPPTAAMSRSPSASTARVRCTACCAAPTGRSSARSKVADVRRLGARARRALPRAARAGDVVRVLETRRGAELARLPHAHAVERLLHSNDGAMLVTVDRAARSLVAAGVGEHGARAPAGAHGCGGERQRVGRRAAARVHARRRRGRRCSTSRPAPSCIDCGSRARCP